MPKSKKKGSVQKKNDVERVRKTEEPTRSADVVQVSTACGSQTDVGDGPCITLEKLNICLVPVDNLNTAEFVFQTEMDTATKVNNKHPGILTIVCILSALLNTCGGQLKVHFLGKHSPYQCWEKFRMTLLEFIPEIMFEFIDIQRKESPSIITIDVKPSNQPLTAKSGLHVRICDSNHTASQIDYIKHVMSQNSETSGAYFKTEFTKESIFPDTEWKQIEFKHWDVSHIDAYKKRLMNDRTKKCLFALGNCPTGGDLFIGVTGDRKVIGQVISADDEKPFREFVCDIFQGRSNSRYKPVWGDCDRVPIEGMDWRVDFLSVTGYDHEERRRLINIHVNHCKGGLFEHPPESYYVDDNSNVQLMDFEQWKKAMNNESVHRTTQPDTLSSEQINSSDNCIQESLTVNTSKQSQATVNPPKPLGGDTGEETVNILETVMNNQSNNKPRIRTLSEELRESEVIEGIKRQNSFLSWSESRENWPDNLLQSEDQLKTRIKCFVEHDIFQMKRPIQLTPERSTITEAYRQLSIGAIQGFLDDVEKQIGEKKAFAISTQYWHKLFKHNMDMSESPNHLMDIVCMDEQCVLHIYSLIKSGLEKVQIQEEKIYLLKSARITKSKLCQKLPFPTRTRVCVKCYLYDLNRRVIMETDSPIFPNNSSSDDIEEFTYALGELVLEQDTLFKDYLGNIRSLCLTAQQMEVYLKSGRFNFIEGPPGSGKTYLALYVCSKFAKDDIGYCCTTETFHNFLVYTEMCKPILVKDESQLEKHIENRTFEKFSCIIFDDIQNFVCSKECWDRFLTITKQKHHVRLFMFADSKYHSFKSSNKMKQAKQFLVQYCDNNGLFLTQTNLKDIHRNKRKIVSFLKSCFEDDDQYSEFANVASSNSADGDDVWLKKMDNIREDSDQNSLVTFTRQLVNCEAMMRADESACEPEDVAVLVDTDKAKEDVLLLRSIFRKYFGERKVQSAKEFPVTGITIDTLDHFLGFERKVCMCVLPNESMHSASQTLRCLGSEKYKAFIASRAVSGVIFIVESDITLKVAEDMKMNYLPYEPPSSQDKDNQSSWDAVEEWSRNAIVSDQSLLKTGNEVNILYLTPKKVCMLSMANQEVEHPIPITGIICPQCLAIAKNQNSMILTYHEEWPVSQWAMAVCTRDSPKWHLKFRTRVEHRPWSVSWTPENQVVMIVKQDKIFQLRKYTQDGQEMWTKTPEQFKEPRHMAIGPDGRMFIVDEKVDCVHVLNAEGNYEHSLPHIPDDQTLVNPHGVCTDAHGQYLFVSHGTPVQYYVSVIRLADLHIKHVMRSTSHIVALSVNSNREQADTTHRLVIGSRKKIHLYNVSQVLRDLPDVMRQPSTP